MDKRRRTVLSKHVVRRPFGTKCTARNHVMEIRITKEKIREVFSFKTDSDKFDEISHCLRYTGKAILLRRYRQKQDTIHTKVFQMVGSYHTTELIVCNVLLCPLQQSTCCHYIKLTRIFLSDIKYTLFITAR